MSSEASTEERRRGVPADTEERRQGGRGDADRPDALQPWQLFTLAGLVGATVVVSLSRGQTPAAIILLSLIVFAAAGVGLAALRTFVPLVIRGFVERPLVLGGRTRAALEREKALVLRSIKELEFDRAMKKVSDKDFAEMSGRLRARASGLMRQLDAGTGYRQEIEREIERRLADSAGRVPRSSEATERGPAAKPALNAGICPSCSTANDIDARFCKGCGTRLEGQA